MSNSPSTKAYILLGILALIWGTSFILIKQGLKVFSADEVGSLRVAFASVALLPIAITKLKELNKGDYAKLFASGMMGIFIPAFLFAMAQTRMPSSVAGILNTLTPIWTMIIGAALFSQRYKLIAIVGIVLGFAGTVMLAMARTEGAIVGFNAFALLIVLACLFYGSNLNLIKFKIPNLKSLTITSVSLMLIGPLAWIYLFGFTEFTTKLAHVEGAWQACGFVVLLGFMSTAVATLLFNQLVKMSTPMFASSVTYLIPIVSVVWGLVDGEHLSVGHFVGMVVVVGGVYLANKR